MPLFDIIIAAIREGKSFSANHTGLTTMKHFDKIHIGAKVKDTANIGYIIQGWAKQSIYIDNPVITFVVVNEDVKIYY